MGGAEAGVVYSGRMVSDSASWPFGLRQKTPSTLHNVDDTLSAVLRNLQPGKIMGTISRKIK